MRKYCKVELISEDDISFDQNFDIKVLRKGDEISDSVHVEMYFTKSALKGFAVNLLRLSENFEEGGHIQIDPLGYSFANQAMGFFITPESSDLIIMCQSVNTNKKFLCDFRNMTYPNRVFQMSKPKMYIKLDSEDDEIEDFELGQNNLCCIDVIENEINIAKECQIVLWLNRRLSMEIGSSLIRWLHFNYSGKVLSITHKEKIRSLFGSNSIENNEFMTIYCLEDEKDIREKSVGFL